jgi:BolA family transcriptional regulator, general stress-responsive regulator
MTVAAQIETKLRTALAPTRIVVTDDSARHAGHAGARPGGETHFTVLVVSAQFAGKARLARHRLVYDLLAAEIAGGVHALALKTLAPDEDRD